MHIKLNKVNFYAEIFLLFTLFSYVIEFIMKKITWQTHFQSTVKHSYMYMEHTYDKVTLTAKWFSFQVTILPVLNLTDITNLL